SDCCYWMGNAAFGRRFLGCKFDASVMGRVMHCTAGIRDACASFTSLGQQMSFPRGGYRPAG
ncbi:MAG: hypothetical protein OJI67_18795, partial [Prosthecobacter sp.]|nr:hypothetical protein [Prosthecobacter sp.]